MTSFEVVTLFTSIVAILLSITSLITQYVVDSKNKKPKPFLRTRKIEVKLPEKINLDWGSEEDTPDYHSVFSISLSNLGITSLIIDNYFFVLENATELKRFLEKSGLSHEFQLTDLKYDGNHITEFKINYIDENGCKVLNKRKYGINFEYGDNVIPGEEFDILLPRYLLIITNYITRNVRGNEIPFPKLRLFIDYHDINRKKYTKEFIVEWGQKYTLKTTRDGIYFKRDLISTLLIK